MLSAGEIGRHPVSNISKPRSKMKTSHIHNGTEKKLTHYPVSKNYFIQEMAALKNAAWWTDKTGSKWVSFESYSITGGDAPAAVHCQKCAGTGVQRVASESQYLTDCYEMCVPCQTTGRAALPHCELGVDDG
jgi:hypothetical protein